MRLGRGTAETVAISPDGETLAVAGSAGVWLYEMNTLNLIGLLEWHGEMGPEPSMKWAIAWSPDGRMLASGSVDGTVSLWDVTTREELAVLEAHTGHARAWVNSVAWSPDGRTLASGNTGWGDGEPATVRLWDVASGEQVDVLEGHTGEVSGVAWSPDGRTLASGGAALQLWDVSSGEQLAVLEGHTFSAESVAWSPDGRMLASAGGVDQTVRLWGLPHN